MPQTPNTLVDRDLAQQSQIDASVFPGTGWTEKRYEIRYNAAALAFLHRVALCSGTSAKAVEAFDWPNSDYVVTNVAKAETVSSTIAIQIDAASASATLQAMRSPRMPQCLARATGSRLSQPVTGSFLAIPLLPHSVAIRLTFQPPHGLHIADEDQLWAQIGAAVVEIDLVSPQPFAPSFELMLLTNDVNNLRVSNVRGLQAN